MSKLRYVWGPRLVGDWSASTVTSTASPTGKPDVTVSADVTDIEPTGDGVGNMEVTFTFPSFDPKAANAITELHAIYYQAGSLIHGKPEVALDSSQPMQGGVPSDALQAGGGGNAVLLIEGIPLAHGTMVSVLGYSDPDVEPVPVVEPPVDSAPTPATTDEPAANPAS